MTRISEHRGSINSTDQNNPVAVHVNLFKHNPSTLRYIGMEAVKTPRRGGDINNIFLKREAFYIFNLNTPSSKRSHLSVYSCSLPGVNVLM